MYLTNDVLTYTIIGIVLLVIAIVCIILFFALKKKRSLKKEDISICKNVIEFLGGKDNIISLENKSSRLVIVLKDANLMNEEELKNIGVSSILKMTSKITLVIGSIAEEIKKYYESL